MISRVLIVGLGSIGKRHLHIARTLFPNSDIRILRHLANNEVHPLSNGNFSCIDEALEFAPNIAVIATPAPFHISAAQQLAEINTHLLIEKPLSINTEGVAQLISTCKKQGVTLLVGYNLRFMSSLKFYRDLLEKNAIGKVLSIRCDMGRYLPSWRSASDYSKNVSARKALGGGVLLELSHEIDYLRWIFGDINWVKATLTRQSELSIDVEDTAHLTLGFTPGPDGHQIVGTVNLDFIRHDAIRLCIAIGEIGSLSWDGITGNVDFYDPKRGEWVRVFQQQHQLDASYISEWVNFIDCINLKIKPLVTGHDGLRCIEVIEAARCSQAHDGKITPVKISTLKIDE